MSVNIFSQLSNQLRDRKEMFGTDLCAFSFIILHFDNFPIDLFFFGYFLQRDKIENQQIEENVK